MTVRRRVVGPATALAGVLLSACVSAPTPTSDSQEIAASLRRIEQQLAQLVNGDTVRNAEIQRALVALEMQRVGVDFAMFGTNHPERVALEEVDRRIAALKAMLTARQ